MSLMFEIIGYTAATLTTVSFLPQAIKVVRCGDTQSISLAMYIIFTAGVIFWLLYGIATCNMPIIFANAITCIFALIILMYKLKEPRSKL